MINFGIKNTPIIPLNLYLPLCNITHNNTAVNLLQDTYYNNWYVGSAGNDGDYFIINNIRLISGVYSLKIIYQKHNNSAIQKVYVNDVLVDTTDTYTGAGVSRNNFLTIADISFKEINTIKIIADGKNVASTGYFITISGICII